MIKRFVIAAAVVPALVLPTETPVRAQQMSLEEIVVTARKRDENIYEIPVSVSAITGDTLDRAGIDTPDDMSALIPGLDFHGLTGTGGRFNPQIRLRGMNQQIITPSTQVAAVFWDGSYMSGGAGFLPLGDLERVEVIKGPQTAYFGRNTFSGAINYIPRLPGDVWEGKVSMDWSPSDGDEYNVNGAVGGPISDNMGIRIWAGHKRDGGDFFTGDGERYGRTDDTTVMGTVTFDPIEDLSLKLTGYFTNATSTGQYGGVDPRVDPSGTAAGACNKTYTGRYFNPGTGVYTPFTRDLSTLGFASWCGNYPDGEFIQGPTTLRPTGVQSAFGARRLDMMSNLNPLLQKYGIIRQPKGTLGDWDRTYRIQFSGDYDVANHTLSFLVSRSNTGLVTVRDFEYGIPRIPNGVLIIGTNIAIRETNYEMRITSPQDARFRYMIGVSDYTQRYRNGRAPGSNELVLGVRIPSPLDFQDNTTTAVFASLDFDVSDEFTISAEMRYTDEKSIGILQGNPNGACSFSPTCNLVDEYDDFIPRVIASYTPFEGATTYASYSYSSLLGVQTQAGFVNSVAPEIIPADQLEALGLFTAPQENEQFELGWKQTTDNWAFTVAAFMIDWKNQPFASVILLPTGGTTSYRGPGDSEYKGLDLDINGNLTENFNIHATLAYVDAEMTSFSSRGSNEFSVLGSGSQSVDNSGNEPRNTPRLSASLSPTFSGVYADRDWFIRADFMYHSAVWADYSEYNRTGDSFRVNLRAGIDLNESSNIELYGRNLTHDKFLPNSNGTTSGIGGVRKAYTALYQKPEIGIRLTADF